MTRSLIVTALLSLALGAPIQSYAEGALLVPVASGPDLPKISQVQFDEYANRLLGGVGPDLVGIDPDSGAINSIATLDSEITAIALIPAPAMVAVATKQRSTIVLIDPENGSTVAEIPAGIDNPEVLAYDTSADVLVVGSRSTSETALVSPDGTIKGLVGLPGPVSGFAVTGRGWVLATATGPAAIYILDSRRGISLGSFPVAGCDTPQYPVLDDIERRLYVACQDGLLLALDSDTGVVLARIPIPESVSDAMLADTDNRDINIIVGTRNDGLWITSGRITATTAVKIASEIDNVDELAGTRGNEVFVVHDQAISRLTPQ